MNELVQRLTEGDHPVRVGGPQPSLEEFQKRVQDMWYAFIKLPDTRGGTDIGLEVDKSAIDLSRGDF